MTTFSYVMRPGVDHRHFVERFVVPFEQQFRGLSPDERTVIDGPCPEHTSAHVLWLQGNYELSGLAELWRN